ncbi:MAG: cytochrome c oxidase subunit II [Pseudomonadota bacterium]
MLLAVSAIAVGTAAAGVPVDGAYGFQPPATELARDAFGFHNILLMPIITAITIFVLALLLWVMVRFNKRANTTPSKTTHNTLIEVVWTTIPVVILVIIAGFSFPLLYKFDRAPDLEALAAEDAAAAEGWINVKAQGNQWNWTYTYPDLLDDSGFPLEFVSNPLHRGISTDEARGLTNLSVDYPVVVPVGRYIRYYTAASDVIHSWAVPAFGIKTDAIPGRLNQGWFKVDEPGVYYGQCSELCGKDHAFMPIEIRVVDQATYDAWTRLMLSGDFDAAVEMVDAAQPDSTRLASAD